MSGVRLSKKHGVNPSITKCFYCGEDTGIALMGALKGDVEAPKYCIVDYEPCDKCKEKMKEFVLGIEAVTTPPHPNAREFQKGVWPTGRSLFVKDRVLKDIMNDEAMLESVLKQRIMLLDLQTFAMFLKMFEAAESAEEEPSDNSGTQDKPLATPEDIAEAKEKYSKENNEDPTPEVIHSQSTIIARKQWECSKCKAVIHKGDEHILKRVRKHGKYIFKRYCLKCGKNI